MSKNGKDLKRLISLATTGCAIAVGGSAQAETVIAYTPTLGDAAGYKVEAATVESDTTFTYSTYDAETQTVTDALYDIDLSTKTYGNGINSEIVNVNSPDAPEITVNYNNDFSDYVIDGSGYEGINVSGDGEYRSNYHEKSIIGDVVNNHITIGQSFDKIEGNIFSNHVGEYGYQYYASSCGALWNAASIDTIDANFIGNSVVTDSVNAFAGAFGNDGAYASDRVGGIGSITGDFVSNFVESVDGFAAAGAISNSSYIGSLNSNFIGNYAFSENSFAVGGAILNDSGGYGYADRANIDEINGDFLYNTAESLGDWASGGAISNMEVSNIGQINGDFVGNLAYSAVNTAAGGAIENYGVINDIKGNFIQNTAEGATYSYGGAIYNGGTIGYVESVDSGLVQNIDIVKVVCTNEETGEQFSAYYVAPEGGSIASFEMLQDALNEGMKIGTVNNYEDIYSVSAEEFEEFREEYEALLAQGQFISQNPEELIANDSYYSGPEFIGGIEGDFIGNVSYSYDYEASGGAIENYGQIANIKGNFGNNMAITDGYFATGGAILNDEQIGVIGGESSDGQYATSFVNNKVSSQEEAYGGAITNWYEINNIKNVVFAENKAEGYYYAAGGAINNSGGFIGAERAYVEENSISPYESRTPYRQEYILFKDKGIINSAFVNNTATSFNSSYGGALYNDYAIVSNISNTLFQGNKAEVLYEVLPTNIEPRMSYTYAYGGAIANFESIIGNIENSVFRNNLVENNFQYNSITLGGAIFNDEYSEIDSIKNTLFEDNTVVSESGSAYGGAIANDGYIGSISGEFKNNAVFAGGGYAGGGAISANYWNSYIGDINANFLNNYTISNGGYAIGGAISYETSYYGDIIGNFINNYAQAGNAYGGAIFIDRPSDIKSVVLSGTYSGNHVLATSEWGRAYGGAIYNGWSQRPASLGGFGDSVSYESNADLTIVNSSFVNNYAKATGENGYAYGGAIYTSRDLDIVSTDGYQSIISGNYVEDVNGKRAEAIYADAYSNLQFVAANSGSIQIDDAVVLDGGAIHFTGDETGKITLNNNVYAITQVPCSLEEEFDNNIYGGSTGVYLSNTNLHLGLRDNVLDNHYLTLNSGTLSMINNEVGVASPYNLTIAGDTKFFGDVDLQNEVMDRFEIKNTYGDYDWDENGNVVDGPHDGNLIVSGLNMVSDMKEGQDTAAIFFAEKGLMNNVETNFGELPHEQQTTFYTPIFKYNAVYDNTNDYGKGEGGYFVFTRGDKIPVIVPGGGSTPSVIPGGNPSNAFNPAVLGSSVSSAAGAMSTMSNTFNYAFQNADNFMNIPYLERIAIRDRNKIALSPTGDATDMGTYSPLFTRQETSSAWVKPYATFENVPLKNGPKVSNITYGTLVGFDTNMESIKGGWDRVITGYIGYNGASQRYSGVDSYQNGGLLGGTMTLYKGNFFNATTISTGASIVNSTNMYGNENYSMFLAGVGNKSGYNLEFKEGRFIIQPSMLLSYTFVNTSDYTNAAGVKIDNDALHALQLSPGVKFIGNTSTGWQPYLAFSMVWNLMDNSSATANGVKLPSMSVKPYVQYGVGVQRRVKDRFMAYGQAMIQNGGRNGLSLTAGFRWAIGRKSKSEQENQKVLKPFLNNKAEKNLDVQPVKSQVGEKKVLKQLSPVQKAYLGSVKYNTSRSVNTGTLKQL